MLHLAFKTTDWSLNKIVKAMWNLFHDSPARRETYIWESQSALFPKKIYTTRWTENQDVVIRAIEIWENMQKTIKEVSSNQKRNRPQCKSYDALLLSYVSDPFMKVKFQSFKDLASHLEVFLRKYQTDDPMMLQRLRSHPEMVD